MTKVKVGDYELLLSMAFVPITNKHIYKAMKTKTMGQIGKFTKKLMDKGFIRKIEYYCRSNMYVRTDTNERLDIRFYGNKTDNVYIITEEGKTALEQIREYSALFDVMDGL